VVPAKSQRGEHPEDAVIAVVADSGSAATGLDVAGEGVKLVSAAVISGIL